MKQKVVIIGHGYLSRLSLIRSLGQAGFDLSVVVTMYGALNTTNHWIAIASMCLRCIIAMPKIPRG